ncbi:MAG TPA: PH domain-containing protein [Verrucomicrobiota bacterium]|nr:hypothetical protein [Verrucomicrobiales bacterium]HRI16536.1 PH domain-containing protein [Verrucomicrobiota bacterium]
MFDRWSGFLMHWLRVPPRPDPPVGGLGSERIFRSGRNAFRLSMTLWAITQLFALAGLVFWLWMLGHVKALRHEDSPPAAVATAANESPTDEGAVPKTQRKKRSKVPPREVIARIARKTPDMAFWVLNAIEGASLLAFPVQIPVTYAIRRLEFEQRWYIVTDRSLRLRSGIWKMQEITMSFANLQQITVTQGPLQRLLGLADVRVQSAGGGGGGAEAHKRSQDTGHLGYFRAVDNAEEIRDLITERLRRFRESGLGDPDENHRSTGEPASLGAAPDVLAAARELLAEAKALRSAVGAPPVVAKTSGQNPRP